MTSFPVLSLWQPWATLIALGAKKIETRSWRPRLRIGQVIAIHAAKKWDSELKRLSSTEPFRTALDGHDIPRGCVVCLAIFDGACRVEDIRDTISPTERAFGDYRDCRWGWRLHMAASITPIPLRGQQGLWTWTPSPDELMQMGSETHLVCQPESNR